MPSPPNDAPNPVDAIDGEVRPRGPNHKGPALDPLPPPITPDGRYIVVRGRLWRRSNPALTPVQRELLVKALMAARRAVREALAANDPAALAAARAKVQASKVALGERGPVWWVGDAPDLTRHLAKNTVYAQWWASQAQD